MTEQDPTRPTLAIIVPCYNAAHKLEPLLSGLRALEDRRVEILFVDDGSTDRTAPALEQFRPAVRRTVMRTPNRGPGAARNLGLSRAEADYVWFVDADDRVSAEPVERHLDHLDGADVVSFASGFDPNAGMLDRLQTAGRLTAKLFRREFLLANAIRFAETYSSEDNFFMLQVGELYRTQRCFPERIYEVVEQPDSLMRGGFNARWISRWRAIGQMLAFARAHPRQGLEALERELVRLSLNLTWAYYMARRRRLELLALLPRLLVTLRLWGLIGHLDIFLEDGSARNRMAKRATIAMALPLSRFAKAFVR